MSEVFLGILPMRLLRRCVCHGLVLTLSVSYAAASGKDKAEEQSRPLLQAAADWLLRPDSSPLKLKLTFEIRGPISKQMRGTYLWLRNGEDWRREILFSDYADVKVGHDTVLWSKRNLDFKPLQAVWVEAVFDNYIYNAADSIERYFTTSEQHVQLQCVDLLRNKQPRTFCFDPQGNLVKAEVKELNMTYEYSDYRQVGQRLVPHGVTLRRKDTLIVDGTIESLPFDAKADAPLFEPPSGAIKRKGCLIPASAKNVKRVSPEYPVAARNAAQQGMVTIYVQIASDGTVHNPVVIQTSGRELDEAALRAVSHWQFEPARCAEGPTDSETTISIKFSLQR